MVLLIILIILIMQQLEQCFLYIHLNQIFLRNNRQISMEYLSFHWQGNFYFSNSYNSTHISNFTITLNHSLVLPVLERGVRLQSIRLQNWQNHMILFEHQVDISELNTKSSTRKKNQIRYGEILDFTISLLTKKEIKMTTLPNSLLLQHFLVIQSLTVSEQVRDNGPSFYKIQYSQGQIVIPVVNSIVLVPLPTKIKFYHYKNGKMLASSRFYETDQINTSQFKAQMIIKQDKGYDLDISLLWASNLAKNKRENNAFLQAHDITLSDISIKFEAREGLKVDVRPEQVTGIKLKVVAGNKTFQLNGDLDPIKPTKFARIIYFIVKSDEQEFSIQLNKGPRVVAKATIGTDQLLSYYPNQWKRKLYDPYSGRAVATVKFRGEKAKNLSLPQNNSFWKNIATKKIQALMLEFSQISLFGSPQPCGLVLKTQQSEVFVPDVLDISIFKLQSQFPQPVTLSMKQEGSVYLKLVPSRSTNNQEFLGIASVNPKDLKLGIGPISIVFYKQKEFICECRMIVNKVMPWPFIKGIFQPESLIGSGLKTMSLSVMLKNIQLTSYYWSYAYEGKGDIYCIVQVSRLKKVLILQRASLTDKLLFLNAAGSDLLNFVVDYKQSFKIKFTLLASDDGIQQQIYGTLQKRIKLEDMSEGPQKFTKLSISNPHSIQVGYLQFQIRKGLIGEFKRSPVKKELNLVKQHLDKINKSIQHVEKNFSPKNKNRQLEKKNRYQSLVLPEIKDPKQQRLKKLAKALQMRQKRRRSPKIAANTLQLDQIQAIRKPSKNDSRVRSQSLNDNTAERQFQVNKPLPLTVQQQVFSDNEKDQLLSRRSEVKMELPSNQFQLNQFISQNHIQ